MNSVITCRGDYQNDSVDAILRIYHLYHRQVIEQFALGIICGTNLASSVGVLLVRANVISSGSFIRPAMFDFELEWTVR